MRRAAALLSCTALLALAACGGEKEEHISFVASEANLAAGYPFSELVEEDGRIYLSGTLGVAPGTMTLVDGGVEAESRQIMENIKATLESHGLGMDRIVKCTVMIDDMADWPAFNSIYAEYFEPGRFPARSAFGADGLALGAALEVECMARR